MYAILFYIVTGADPFFMETSSEYMERYRKMSRMEKVALALQSNFYEMLMAVLLCVNMLWMALEIQRHDLFDGVAKFLLVNDLGLFESALISASDMYIYEDWLQTWEPGSLIKLLVPRPKTAPSKVDEKPEATEPKEDEDTFDTFEDDSFDHADAAMDDMDTSDKVITSKAKARPSPPRRMPGVPAPQRKLRGSIAEKLGKRGPAQKPNPPNIDALKGSRRRMPGFQPPAAVWERCVDERRNAVYYWEHVARRASWQPPPMHEGWWERLYDEKSRCEFFWNSASQLTLWHLPLPGTPQAMMQPVQPAVFSSDLPFAVPSCPSFPTVPAPKTMPKMHERVETKVEIGGFVEGFERSGLLSTGSDSRTGVVKVESIDLDLPPQGEAKEESEDLEMKEELKKEEDGMKEEKPLKMEKEEHGEQEA
eukprot:s261_g3.t1